MSAGTVQQAGCEDAWDPGRKDQRERRPPLKRPPNVKPTWMGCAIKGFSNCAMRVLHGALYAYGRRRLEEGHTR